MSRSQPDLVITKSGKTTRIVTYHTSLACPYVARMDSPKIRDTAVFPIDDKAECSHPQCGNTMDPEMNTDNDPLEFQRKHGLLDQ